MTMSLRSTTDPSRSICSDPVEQEMVELAMTASTVAAPTALAAALIPIARCVRVIVVHFLEAFCKRFPTVIRATSQLLHDACTGRVHLISTF